MLCKRGLSPISLITEGLFIGIIGALRRQLPPPPSPRQPPFCPSLITRELQAATDSLESGEIRQEIRQEQLDQRRRPARTCDQSAGAVIVGCLGGGHRDDLTMQPRAHSVRLELIETVNESHIRKLG